MADRLTERHVRGLPVVAGPLVMGVVNVTPDSFSDGGRFHGVDDAVAHGFVTTVRLDASRGIDLDGSMDAMMVRMKAAGVRLA